MMKHTPFRRLVDLVAWKYDSVRCEQQRRKPAYALMQSSSQVQGTKSTRNKVDLVPLACEDAMQSNQRLC